MALTVDSVKTMKVAELKAELSSRGLSDTGLKAVLVERLKEAIETISSDTDLVAAAAAEVAETAPPPASAQEAPAVSAPADAATPTATVLLTQTPAEEHVNQVFLGTSEPSPVSVTSGKPSSDKKGKQKKKKKRRGYNEPTVRDESAEATAAADTETAKAGLNDKSTATTAINIEYVPETIEGLDDASSEFAAIFSKFQVQKEVLPESEPMTGTDADATKEMDAAANPFDSDEEVDETKLSKTKLKKLNRLSVAELKQLVSKPDVVEVHDVSAADPKLLVLLKAARNSVPVPKHWSMKRKYLQGKRGIEKGPFELPQYIIDTGILDQREAQAEKEDRLGLKGKLREKTRPKMGKIDIDYQKLHDAFFRWQTKPKMTLHGDLYFEGKEFETTKIDRKPGDLSEELRVALGMPIADEAKAQPIPPPWLLHMQRYGPPPSYPNLKIPGLNAGIPEGASFGFHPGGWGKPPVDEYGRPVYGDVFAKPSSALEAEAAEEDINTELWGQLESDESEDESSDEDGSDSEGGAVEAEEADEAGLVTPSGYTSESPSDLTSINTGMETPDAIDLRKRKQAIESAMDDSGEQQTLYKVLGQKDGTAASAGGLMGSQNIYDIEQSKKGSKKTALVVGDGLEITVDDPDQLNSMDLKARYDAMETAKAAEKEDFSDMVADHASKAAKKRKAAKKEDPNAKKFKF